MEQHELGAQLVRLLPRLRRFAVVLTRSGQDTDDLLQSAVLRALSRASHIETGDHLDRWMFRILKTVWLNARRAERYRRCEPIEDRAVHAVVDGAREIENAAELNQVGAALERLPPGQRLPLTLICIEGYTYAEAADVLHLPIGTLTSRLARGRLALLRALRPVESRRSGEEDLAGSPSLPFPISNAVMSPSKTTASASGAP
jgi:RNA polymerase sigma-70 factor (ECF subfamily)